MVLFVSSNLHRLLWALILRVRKLETFEDHTVRKENLRAGALVTNDVLCKSTPQSVVFLSRHPWGAEAV